MKILSGRFKDAPIPFKPQPGLRPTPDRVRKAIIDALSPGWSGTRVLDLFSGTGALGFEALSAGAAGAVFVESDRRRAVQIEQMIEELGLADACRVEREGIWTSLDRLVKKEERFDRVLADPPYEKGLAPRVLDFFKEGTALNPGAWLALETYKKELMPEKLGRLENRRSVFYGDTAVHYYVLV